MLGDRFLIKGGELLITHRVARFEMVRLLETVLRDKRGLFAP
jgi:hypothetical protein